jgi:hypothetical protein
MSLIEIRPPNSLQEYHQACALVEEVYFERGITSQRAVRHPKAIIVAVREGEVLGSVGLRAGDQGTLPVENYFGFAIEEISCCERAAVGEVVKLAASKTADLCVFKGLVAACAQYFFVERSFELAAAIAKPKLEATLRRFLHVPTTAFPYAVVHDRAMADYPKYFFEGPCPLPISFQRSDYPLYLEKLLTDLKGKAAICWNNFDHRCDYSNPSTYSSLPSAALAA